MYASPIFFFSFKTFSGSSIEEQQEMPRFYSLYRMKSLCCTASSSHGPFVVRRSVRPSAGHNSASFLTRYYRGVGQVFPQQLQLHLLVHHLIPYLPPLPA